MLSWTFSRNSDRPCFSSMPIDWRIWSVASVRTRSKSSWSISFFVYSRLGCPTTATNPSCSLIISLITPWAWKMASITSSSEVSWALPSTDITAFSLPPTKNSKSHVSISSTVGLITNSSLIRPITIAPTGPLNGMSETDKAADAPINDGTSAECLPSKERTVHKTCISLLKSFGKRGRMQWSINLAVNCSLSPGRGSRRP